MKKESILIVDDAEINRQILRQIFKDEYEILEASNGEEALLLTFDNCRYLAAVLIDIIMPVMDGFQYLEKLREKKLQSYIPIVMMTGEDSDEYEVKGLKLGAADFIRKPFNSEVVRQRVENLVKLYRYEHQLQKQVLVQNNTISDQKAKLQEMNNDLVETMSNVVEFRNMESGQHVKRIKKFSRVMADEYIKNNPECGLTETDAEMIEITSALHDVGKIYISDAILTKPAKLTAEEFEIMKSHTIYGGEIIEGSIRFTDDRYAKCAYNIARYHHEKYNGGGYPEGLKGEKIPIEAQIVSIADVFDALVSPRVYKKAYDTETAYRMIINGECGEFSPKIMACFISVKPKFQLLAKTYGDKEEVLE